MKKLVLVLMVAALLVPTSAFCEMSFGVNAGIMLPTGDLKDAGADTGFSFGGRMLAPVSSDGALLLGLSLGLNFFSGENVFVDYDAINVEILPTARYEFAASDSVKLIAQGSVGLEWWTIDSSLGSDSGTEFGFAVGGGLKFGKHLETLALYKSFDEDKYVTITLGYNF